MKKKGIFLMAAIAAFSGVCMLAGCSQNADNVKGTEGNLQTSSSSNENRSDNSNADGDSEDNKKDSANADGKVKVIRADEIFTGDSGDLDKDIQLVDIRSSDKYIGWKNAQGISGHIAGAVDFPASWFSYGISDENMDMEFKRRHLDKEKKTVLYDDGEVSEDDYSLFEKAGFGQLYVLAGGIDKFAEKNKEKLERLEGYQRYVSPQWVEDLVNGKTPEGYSGKKYRIVEIYLPSEKDDYTATGHIKGAVALNADDINHIPGPRDVREYESIPIQKQLTFWNLPQDQDIKRILEGAGIDIDTTVILYGSEKATTAANRAAFVMDYAGVKDIRLLNGGKPLWVAQNRELEKESPSVEKVDFGTEVPQNPEIRFDYEKELKLIEDKGAVIASVRSFDEYLSKKSGYTYIDRAGEIKNSRFAYAGSDPYAMEDYRNIDNTMFNYKLIEERWKLWGITGDKLVSFHCGTGWRASETYYIAKALGWKDVGVYVGGWYEWTKKQDAPVMKPGLPEDAPENTPQEYFYKK